MSVAAHGHVPARVRLHVQDRGESDKRSTCVHRHFRSADGSAERRDFARAYVTRGVRREEARAGMTAGDDGCWKLHLLLPTELGGSQAVIAKEQGAGEMGREPSREGGGKGGGGKGGDSTQTLTILQLLLALERDLKLDRVREVCRVVEHLHVRYPHEGHVNVAPSEADAGCVRL